MAAYKRVAQDQIYRWQDEKIAATPAQQAQRPVSGTETPRRLHGGAAMPP